MSNGVEIFPLKSVEKIPANHGLKLTHNTKMLILKDPSLLDFITDPNILKLVILRLASKSLKNMYRKS